ncbi:MAG: methionyl-tRNA formyltransferase [Coriobacteriales bacterium]|jgi:methionyl-tRNA formyltransferase
MRIVFMGTPEFAVPSLRALAGADGIEVVAAYSQPDSVSRRGKKPQPSAVRVAAEELGIEVRTPETLRDSEVVDELASFAPDVIVVASYGKILPREVLDVPPLGCINVHASLLPRWRGAAPIERAILAEDAEAGVSIMNMEEGLDTGAFCLQASIPVGELRAPELTAGLAELGATTLLEALPAIAAGEAVWTEQDEAGVTYAEKVSKAEMLLSPELGARDNVLRVRASSDHAPAKATVCGRGLTVLEARVCDAGECPAEAVSLESGAVAFVAKRLFLGAADGPVEVLAVKPDGKREMDARSFAAGINAQLKSGDASWT